MRAVGWLALLAAGCAAPDLQIITPEDGGLYQVGTELRLEAEVTRADGTPATAETTWIAPGWEGQGNPLTTTELPYGDFTLRAESTVEGTKLVDAVELSLHQVVAPVDYVGVLDMDSDIHSPDYGDFQLPCDHEDLHFRVEMDGSFVGEGSCSTTFTDFVFDLSGQVSWDEVTGEMQAADTDQVLPFEGTRASNGDVDCTYDTTWANEDGSLRLHGSFTASPR